MIRCIRTEFKKCMYFPFFLLAALGTLALCLAAIGEYDYTGKSRTILEMMVRGVDGQTVDQSGLVLWLNGCSGWLTLILPLLTTFGYLVTLSSERQSGETGAVLLRAGNLRYCMGKVTGGALAGGVGAAAGYGLFGLLMAAVFPAFSGFPPEEQGFYLEIYGASSSAVVIVKRLLGFFLYGIFVSFFGIGVAVAVRDRYMLLCLPFLMNYVYTQVVNKLLWGGSMDGPPGLGQIFSMDTVMDVSADPYWGMSLVFMAVVYVALVFLFWLEVKRRGYYG